ncbi:MAG: hypothetical protein KDB27_02860 [Planctomycetales bacterium]|nr:hypothetical protein [Planctomycetales bacterium]
MRELEQPEEQFEEINKLKIQGDGLQPIYNQTCVEHTMINHAQDALITAMEWQTSGNTFTRKLSSIRFAWHILALHLDRIFAIEECDGYMTFVSERSPHQTEKILQLELEHDEFRDEMKSISATLERLLPTDHNALQTVVQRIKAMLQRFTNHSRHEIALIQAALNDDLGGSD